MDIINHKLEKTDNGYIVYLYLDPYQEEFSSEFLTNIKDKQKNIHEMVDQYIKGRLSGVKIITANIVIGATLLTSIPIGPAVEAHDASFNMSYLYFGNTATAINAVDETNGNLDVISPSYFDLESDGTLKLTSMLDPLFIDEMHKRGIKVVPFLSNHWDREKGRAALNNREELANQIANAIIEYNLDGVNIDIENVTEIDRNNYTDFVRLISEKLPDDKEVSVAIAANPNQWSKGWHGSYDNNQLAKYADYLMLMAYDEHYQGGQAGPVASINWVDKSIETLVVVEGVPPEKVVLGLPFFGRYWNSAESTGGYGASNHQIESLIVKYNGKTTFDTESQSPKATFTLTEGDPPSIIAGRTLKPGTYEVWYENNQSIEAKIDLVHKYNLKGTGSWSLGQENPTVWENFGIWLSEHNADSVSGSYQTTSSFPFHDVSNNYWARDEILYVNQKGWFKGIDDITFAPQEKITRAQAAAVLVRSLDLEALKPLEDSFSDVSRNYWAKESIEIAKQHGIFLGKQDGTFGPNEKLTREHMAVLLDRLFHEYYDFEKTNDPVYFKDVPRDKWSYDAIASTNQQGIFKGIDKYTFKPEDTVTRAQMAAVLTRSADRVSKLKGEQLFSNMLKIDSQGADVVLLQIYLKNVDLGNITVTGKFDNETANAVRVFQQKNNLSVDGIVGPETSQKLIDVKISYR